MGITDKISHAAERKAFETIPDGKWAHYTQRLIRENDPYILKTFLTNAAYEGGFRGYQTAQENAAKYDINVPWLILMDPTSACNMHCTGCWAAEYGHKQSLTFDRVLTEAKALVPTPAFSPAASRCCGKKTSSACAKSTGTWRSTPSPTAPSSTRSSVRRCCGWATSSCPSA